MRTPVLAVGDSALGFWNALREIFPGNPPTSSTRYRNRLSRRPAFANQYGAKYPRVVEGSPTKKKPPCACERTCVRSRAAALGMVLS